MLCKFEWNNSEKKNKIEMIKLQIMTIYTYAHAILLLYCV